MTTYKFDEIKRQAKKRVPCESCGKKVARQKTFTMTENPFNKNPDGTVRTYDDIREALRVQAQEWTDEQDGELCGPCFDLKWRFG